jgi:hypothetical protein
VLLIELIAMSGTREGYIDVHLRASLTSRHCKTAIASWSVILNLIRIKFARLGMIQRLETRDEFTCPIDLALVVVVTAF